jgi:hypothetical protein
LPCTRPVPAPCSYAGVRRSMRRCRHARPFAAAPTVLLRAAPRTVGVQQRCATFTDKTLVRNGTRRDVRRLCVCVRVLPRRTHPLPAVGGAGGRLCHAGTLSCPLPSHLSCQCNRKGLCSVSEPKGPSSFVSTAAHLQRSAAGARPLPPAAALSAPQTAPRAWCASCTGSCKERQAVRGRMVSAGPGGVHAACCGGRVHPPALAPAAAAAAPLPPLIPTKRPSCAAMSPL